MSGFSASWLTLREPADATARSREATAFVARSLAVGSGDRIVDLGAGTGSNARYLTPLLPAGMRWRLVDDDGRLLRIARDRLAGDVETVVADLRDTINAPVSGCVLVTASALLDLVSETWLFALIERCRAARAPVLFALNYDGRVECVPHDADDEFVVALVNAHQRTDKGFGPALGPLAGRCAESMLCAAGYDVLRRESDWVLGTGHSALQTELVRGWAHAAREIAPHDASRIDRWRDRRLAHVDASSSRLRVGHDDVAGVWPALTPR